MQPDQCLLKEAELLAFAPAFGRTPEELRRLMVAVVSIEKLTHKRAALSSEVSADSSVSEAVALSRRATAYQAARAAEGIHLNAAQAVAEVVAGRDEPTRGSKP